MVGGKGAESTKRIATSSRSVLIIRDAYYGGKINQLDAYERYEFPLSEIDLTLKNWWQRDLLSCLDIRYKSTQLRMNT